jgi:hypothetical protein
MTESSFSSEEKPDISIGTNFKRAVFSGMDFTSLTTWSAFKVSIILSNLARLCLAVKADDLLASRLKPSNHANMKWIFSVCVFLLMLVMATAQQPASLNATNVAVTNAVVAGETIEQTKAKAEKGDAVAQSNLGFCYATGDGVAKDAVVALKWYRKAAEQGNAYAQFIVGICYYSSDGVPKDMAETVKWFRKAADQGYAPAQECLGECYEWSFGVTKDAVEAAKWYRKAAEQGYALSESSFGECYWKGFGVPKDMAEAVKWFRKAAEQGNANAQYTCYTYGDGVPKDYVQAYKWFNLASDRGYEDAKQGLSIIKKRMSSEQIAEAQRLARGFKPIKAPELMNSLQWRGWPLPTQ